MKYLIDTHTLLWLLDDELAIPTPTLRQLRDPVNQLFVSIASVWEISIKRSLGKLTINLPTQTIADELLLIGIVLLPILTSHVIQVEALPFHRRDPFDRIIIAQAMVEGCMIVSKDGIFPLFLFFGIDAHSFPLNYITLCPTNSTILLLAPALRG